MISLCVKRGIGISKGKVTMYKVYKVVSKRDATTVYIGSTKLSLRDRLSGHITEIHYCSSSRKHIWFAENKDFLDILQISTADTKLEALYTEEAEIMKHIAEGYTILNTRLPTSGKRIFSDNATIR